MIVTMLCTEFCRIYILDITHLPGPALLPTAYVVREEVIFSVCLFVHIGGYPIPGPDGGEGTPSS